MYDITLKYKHFTQNHRSHTLQNEKVHPIVVFLAVDDVVEASAEVHPFLLLWRRRVPHQLLGDLPVSNILLLHEDI